MTPEKQIMKLNAENAAVRTETIELRTVQANAEALMTEARSVGRTGQRDQS